MHVVIVGAGYAGLACALRLSRVAEGARSARGRNPSLRLRVTLINAEPMFVERIRLHEQLAGSPAPQVSLPNLLHGSAVALRIARVERIDLESRVLTLAGAAGPESMTWDRLVLATGSRMACDVPGAREHAFRLEGDSTEAFVEQLPELVRRRAHVLVAGGGLTGIEAACELAESCPELQVQLVTRGTLAGDWSRAAREHVLARCAALHIRVHENCEVQQVHAGAVDVLFSDSHGLRADRLECDACVWSGGFVALDLAREAGLSVNARGQVLTDAQLRSCSHAHVYAVGDAAVPGEPVGDPLPMGCKSALPMGVHAAENLARELRNEQVEPLRFASPLFCVSLGRRDGLIQFRSADKSLRGRILRGALAAGVKELVCRGTLWFLRLESVRARWAQRLRWQVRPQELVSEVDSAH